jgi:hypothetical protein
MKKFFSEHRNLNDYNFPSFEPRDLAALPSKDQSFKSWGIKKPYRMKNCNDGSLSNGDAIAFSKIRVGKQLSDGSGAANWSSLLALELYLDGSNPAVLFCKLSSIPK